MDYKIKTIPEFEKQVKRLYKKYPSLVKDLLNLISTLKKNPNQGIALGHNCFKIRLSIQSKGKGKSGGARVISCVISINKEVFLLNIYDKAEKDSISKAELEYLINKTP
jgi:mRNA-degrading endonuclease RelE of RelBE toxin-antitoxin system